MPDPGSDYSKSARAGNSKGIGFGIFLLVAGIVLLAERTGWLPTGVDWLLPAALIIWGASELYQRLSNR